MMRRVLLVPLVAIVGVLLSGCVNQPAAAPATPKIVGPKVVVEEYHAEAKIIEFPLPDGYTYPKQLPGKISNDDKFEKEAGGFYAVNYWQCAWMQDFLDSFDKGDATEQTAALDSLDHWREIPYVQKWFIEDPNGSFAEAIVKPARLGDPGPMREFSADCFNTLAYK